MRIYFSICNWVWEAAPICMRHYIRWTVNYVTSSHLRSRYHIAQKLDGNFDKWPAICQNYSTNLSLLTFLCFSYETYNYTVIHQSFSLSNFCTIHQYTYTSHVYFIPVSYVIEKLCTSNKYTTLIQGLSVWFGNNCFLALQRTPGI